MHLKIFERNLLCEVKDLTREQDRLSLDHKSATGDCPETRQILEQILNQKDLLLQEIELLRKENAELRENLQKYSNT